MDVLARRPSLRPPPVSGPARLALALALALAGAGRAVPAQVTRATPSLGAMRTGETHPHAAPPTAPVFDRLVVTRASLSLRYRYLQLTRDAAALNQAQYQAAVRARLALDGGDRLALHAGVFTGNRFVGGWNRTGWGDGDPQPLPYLKHLWLSASPARGLTIEAGGLDLLHGVATDLTGYAFEGYMTGQRLLIGPPALPFLDELSAAVGFLGDLDRPGVARRLRRLDEVNFAQLVGTRAWGATALSADVSVLRGVWSVRHGVRARLATPATDLVTAELRLGEGVGPSYGAYAEKRLDRALRLGVGYGETRGDILNSDRYGEGSRLFLMGHATLSPEWSVSTYLTHSLSGAPAATPRSRLDLAVGWNAVPALVRWRGARQPAR